MLPEQFEFLISQYADGTLPAPEAAALESRLADDADARAMLDEYRGIDAALKRELAMPEFKWDRLSAHLSDRIAEADERACPAPIALYARLRPILTIAASVMIGFGLAALIYRQRPTHSPPTMPTHAAHHLVASAGNSGIEVTGPSVELAAGRPVAQITVGASPLARQVAAAEAIVYRPPRIVIASSQSARRDASRLPY